MASPVVFITGTSSGIGKAAAEHFLDEGWRVVAAQRNPWKNRLPANERALVVPIDVTDASSVQSAVRMALDRFGRIDVLVNNAGYGVMGPFEGTDARTLEAQLRTNFFGTANLIREVLSGMRRQGKGVIINVSSVGGRMGMPFIASYNASKFAVEGLSESLRYELRAHGIAVKIVEPGGTNSDFMGRSQVVVEHPAYAAEFAGFRKAAARLNARLGTPEAVARVIHLAAVDRSDRLRYSVNAGPLPALHALLPDTIFRRMLGRLIRAERNLTMAGGAQ